MTASEAAVSPAEELAWAQRYAGPARDVYRRTLTELAKADDRVFCVDSDTGGLETGFAREFPSRYVNVGIAEANLMGVAAGLAAVGWLPYAHTFSSFAACRACEQLKIDIAGNDLPVRVVVTHAGLSAGHYGPTHHAAEDLAIVRSLPNMTVVVPADAAETERAVLATARLPGPLFLRLGRAATPLVYTGPYEFRVGEASLLRPGTDVTIIGTGPWPVTMALAAHRELAREGIRARVLNMHTIKPLDAATVVSAAAETAGIVTVEDHVLAGGLGGAVCETLAETLPCHVRRIGIPDGFLDHAGGETDLLAAAGVTPGRIVAAARELAIPGRAGRHG
jgi:transketolase